MMISTLPKGPIAKAALVKAAIMVAVQTASRRHKALISKVAVVILALSDVVQIR